MTIYKSSNKLDDIYIGSTKISKVYKGSTLVYEKKKGVPVWGFDSNTWLVGDYSTNGLVDNNPNNLIFTLLAINGSLGQSDSSITIKASNGYSSTASYSYNLIVNNYLFHKYTFTSTYTKYQFYVLQGSVVGNYVLCFYKGGQSMDNEDRPISVSAKKIRFRRSADQIISLSRNGANDGYFIPENGIVIG